MIVLKSQREIKLMRHAGRLVARAHQIVQRNLEPGVTTQTINDEVDAFVRDNNGIPSFKGYRGFPASVCISINEELVHGIPGSRRLQKGDVVSVDIGVIYKGFHGDSAWTYIVGASDDETQRLLGVTEASLDAGIQQARAGHHLSDIGHAVQTVVEDAGFSIVREYVGHGIGRQMHEDPQIPNYGDPGQGPVLKAGMTLAIEPMVCQGDWHTRVLDDKWTVISADRSLTAHFEHTIVVTEDGAQLLTVL